MIRLKTTAHAQNCVKPERPQNKYIKPFQFKSREQNGGQIDPRINVGGRPKIIGQTLEQRLMEEIESTIPDPKNPESKIAVKVRRLDLVVDSLINNAMSRMPHSVSAFRTIREIVEPTEEEQKGSSDRELTRVVAQLFLERKVDATEI